MAEDYYCQNQKLAESFTNTLNEIKNLTKKHRNMVASELERKNKSIVERFDKTLKTAESANSLLQNIKSKCKPIYSALTFWKSNRKDYLGYNILDLDPNRILNEKFGTNNVEESLRGVIRLIDPMDDVSDLKIDGNLWRYFACFLNQLTTII